MAYKLHLNENELSNTYYISDIHFGHKNVIKFDDRPYSTVEEMDSDMIRIWNETIPENGVVFIVGDLFFRCSSQRMKEIIEQLNGQFIFIKGNHDTSMLNCKPMLKYFDLIETRINLYTPDRLIVMDHYPMLEWDQYFRGYYHVYGHVHANKPHPEARALDLGWRLHNKPLHYSEVLAKIEQRKLLMNE